jgi:hypothetical protein
MSFSYERDLVCCSHANGEVYMINHLQQNAVEFLEHLCIWKILCLKWLAGWMF